MSSADGHWRRILVTLAPPVIIAIAIAGGRETSWRPVLASFLASWRPVTGTTTLGRHHHRT